MKMLNLNDNLTIQEVELLDINRVVIPITKKVTKMTLSEVSEYLSQYFVGDMGDNVYIDVVADSNVSATLSKHFYLTVCSYAAKQLTTNELKFEERHLGAREEILEAVSIPNYIINRLLNYKNKVENLQINLIRKNKTLMSMVG